MYKKIISATIIGVEVELIQVETDVSDGLPNFTMIGYLTSQTKEAGDRVRTAIRNIGIYLPPKRITVNLAPANIRKDGSRFDLAIAVGILAAVGKLKDTLLSQCVLVGELSLNGEINPVTGVLPIISHAKKVGIKLCIIPKKNLYEGSLVEGIQVIGVNHLQEVLSYLNGERPIQGVGIEKVVTRKIEYACDFREIRGQLGVKRGVEIAVSGFHNILLLGPPGAGKTMIAKRIPTILPSLSLEESLEISKVYSIAGLLSEQQPYLGIRPFRSPHHTASPQALAGGGLIPSPGEITLAHQGVLFLDEIPEFSRRSLEILRQPLEEKIIHIARASGTYSFPADFLLVAAMNHCPCGFYPDLNRCNCSQREVERYRNRISQALLDRIDLCVEAPAVTYEELLGEGKVEESSESIQKRVENVHRIQRERYKKHAIHFNSQLSGKYIEKYCVMTKEAKTLLENSFKKLCVSARGFHRIIKVSRTIADMEEAEKIDTNHIAEAVCYRTIEKGGVGVNERNY